MNSFSLYFRCYCTYSFICDNICKIFDDIGKVSLNTRVGYECCKKLNTPVTSMTDYYGKFQLGLLNIYAQCVGYV